jgi:hypothetical protein
MSIVMAPAPDQKNRAGYDYVGTVHVRGLPIYVEQAPGHVRSGTDPNGKPWSVKMKFHYGEIAGTEGADGDPIDAFVGPDLGAPTAYVIHQRHHIGSEHGAPGSYDEDKIMLGFRSREDALAAYAEGFDHNVGEPPVTEIEVDELAARHAAGELANGSAITKAGPHKYTRREPKPGGGFRYFYDDEPAPAPKKKPTAKPAPAPTPRRPRAAAPAVRREIESEDEYEDRMRELADRIGLRTAMSSVGHKPGGGAIRTHGFNVRMLGFDDLKAALGKKPDKAKVDAFLQAAAAESVAVNPSTGWTADMVAEDIRDRAAGSHAGRRGLAIEIPQISSALQEIESVYDNTSRGRRGGWLGRVRALELLAEHFGKSLDGYEDEIEKAGKARRGRAKPPPGYEPIPMGKHGGFRKRNRDGSYDYWYPRMQHPGVAAWEGDPSKTHKHAEPGDLVEVGGRAGLYRFTPEHAPAAAGHMWVTSLSTGEHEKVRASTVKPVRQVEDRPAPTKPRASTLPRTPPPKAKPAAARASKREERPAGKKRGAEAPAPTKRSRGPAAPPMPPLPPAEAPIKRKLPPKPAQGNEQAGDKARPSKVYQESTAAEGSIHWNLENGAYALRQVKDRSGVRFRWTIHVPEEDRVKLVAEFTPLLHRAAHTIARRYHVKEWIAGEVSPQYEDLLSGAKVGLFKALMNYDGSKPWLPHALNYATLYTIQAARSMHGATVLTEKQSRVVKTFLAARAQAGGNASPEQIAKRWYVKKKDVFTGAKATIGYTRGADGVIRRQDDDDLPMNPWRVLGPDGKPVGKEYPGKLQLIEKIGSLMAGGAVQDSEWMLQNQGSLPAVHQEILPIGTESALRDKVDAILNHESMPEEYREVLRMRFGFHTPDGAVADAQQISDKLGLAPKDAGEATKRRRVAALYEQAVEKYRKIDTILNTRTARHVDDWTAARPPEQPSPEATGYSLNQLTDRFGNEERARVFLGAVRGGFGDRAAKVLEAERAGKATPRQQSKLRRDYSAQIDRERIAAFHRYRATPVEPEAARDIEEQGFSPLGSVHAIEDQYMMAVAKLGLTKVRNG